MAHEHIWNTNFEASPASSDQASEGALRIRNLKEAIRERMEEGHYWDPDGVDANHGKHTTPTFIDNGSDPAAPTGTNEVKLYNNGGILKAIKTGGVGSPIGIPPGTKMLFKQDAAPIGWTFVAEDNDRILLNTGTMSEGGATGGSWTISGLSGLANDHTLTVDEIPAHRHEYTVFITNGQFPWPSPQRYAASDFNNQYTEYTGGGQPHNHTLSLSSDASWRPAYSKVITCTKD